MTEEEYQQQLNNIKKSIIGKIDRMPNKEDCFVRELRKFINKKFTKKI